MARVIPPLNDALPRAGYPFFSIMDSMLVHGAPETPPAAYNAGTNYAVAAQCSVANAGSDNALDVYESLVTPNTGHTPASSPTFWKFIGTTYPVWAAGTFAANDRVIDATTHYEWLSLVPGNTAQPGTDPAKWKLVGANNRWRMFDLLKNDYTTLPSGSFVEFTPGQRVDAIGAVGLYAKQITIEVIVGGIVKKTYVEKLSARTTRSWFQYFFGGFRYRSRFARFDLTPYSGATIRVTFTGINGGDVRVSRLIAGMSVYLGRMLYDTENDGLNFSSVNRDLEGNTELVPRRTVPKLTGNIRTKKDLVARLLLLRDQLNAIPALWSGLEDSRHGYFEALLILGVYKRLAISVDKIEDTLIPFEFEEA